MAIQNSECKEYHENDARNLPAVQRLAEAEDRGIDREVVEEHMGLWGKMYLEPGFRDFLFRYVQGRLHTNQNRAAYIIDQEPYCTFCTVQLEQ